VGLSDYIVDLQALVVAGKHGADDARNALTVLCARGQAIAAALDDVERQKVTTLSIPRDVVLGLATDLATFHRSLWDDLDYPSDMFTALRDAQRALYNLLLYRRGFTTTRGRTAGTSSREYPAADLRPLVPYIVRPGDTLERLALRLLGDVTRSWEVIDLNELRRPFFDTSDPPCTTGPNIARPGDLLYLPPDAIVPQREVTQTQQDADLYGRDMVVYATGYVEIDVDELAIVEGVKNITQALYERIATTVGELVLHADYGIEGGLIIGTEGTPDQIAFNGLEVAKTVAQDPRVTRVADVVSAFSGTANKVSMNVYLIGPGERSVPINLVLPDLVATAP
jgi:hypothetical protein